MRAKLEKLEDTQDSQKLLLQHMSHAEAMVEELALAAQNGDIKSCTNLISAGVSLNEPDSAGFLPLHYACSSGSIATTTLLLQHGSDVSSYLTGTSPMEIAARHGCTEIISILHQYGADLNDSGSGGSPPIVSATAGAHVAAVERLLALGAKVNNQDLQGYTALHMCSRLESPKAIIALLLSNGGDKNARNRVGQNPVQLALSVLNPQAIEALGRGMTAVSKEEEIAMPPLTTAVAGGSSLYKSSLDSGRNEGLGLAVDTIDQSAPQNSVFSAMTAESATNVFTPQDVI